VTRRADLRVGAMSGGPVGCSDASGVPGVPRDWRYGGAGVMGRRRDECWTYGSPLAPAPFISRRATPASAQSPDPVLLSAREVPSWTPIPACVFVAGGL